MASLQDPDTTTKCLSVALLMSTTIMRIKPQGQHNYSLSVHMAQVSHVEDVYHVSNTEQCHNFKSLIDRGANVGIAGDDMRLIANDDPIHTIGLQGIDNHEIPQLNIGTCCAVVCTQRGEVILVFNHYVHNGWGKSIHSSLQLED